MPCLLLLLHRLVKLRINRLDLIPFRLSDLFVDAVVNALSEVIIINVHLVHHASIIVVAGLRVCSSIRILEVAIIKAQLVLIFTILNDILFLFLDLVILNHQFVFVVIIFTVLAQEIREFVILTLDTL